MTEYLHPAYPEEACNLARELQSVHFIAGGSETQEFPRLYEYIINLKDIKALCFAEYGEAAGGRIGAAMPFSAWRDCAVLENPYPKLYEFICRYGRDEQLKNGTLGGKLVCNNVEIINVLKQLGGKLKIQDADHWYRMDVGEFAKQCEKGRLQPDEIITEILLPGKEP